VLPDGNLVSGSDDKTIRVWNVATRECIRIIKTKAGVFRLVVLSDGTIVTFGWRQSTINVWDVTTGTFYRTVDVKGDTKSLLALPHDRVARGTQEGNVLVWNVATGECEMSIKAHPHGVWALAALQDGRLASGSGDNTITIWP
jgi:WD40 repeat protein